MFPCRSRFRKKKSPETTLRLGPKIFEKISGYPIFRCFWVFWDRCHYRKFFLTRFQFLGPGSRKKIGRKNFVPILSVWARKSFETLSIIVIFRKKKAAQKKKSAKKKSEKKFQSVLFPCLRAAPWFCWCSRLASLAQSSLGPAQYVVERLFNFASLNWLLLTLFCHTFSSSLPWFPEKIVKKISCPSC